MNCGKTVEWIEALSEMVDWVAQRNHVSDGVQLPHGKGQFLADMHGQRDVTYEQNVPSTVQKRLNQSSCRLE